MKCNCTLYSKQLRLCFLYLFPNNMAYFFVFVPLSSLTRCRSSNILDALAVKSVSNIMQILPCKMQSELFFLRVTQ